MKISSTWTCRVLFPPQAEETDKGHGRLETRRIWTSVDLNNYSSFPHIGQVITIERERTLIKTGETSLERSHWFTTASTDRLSPQELLVYAREHGFIENRLHWVRDVTFNEDRSQIRTRSGPRMMACLRNLAISLMRTFGSSNLAATRRDMAFKPHLALAVLGL